MLSEPPGRLRLQFPKGSVHPELLNWISARQGVGTSGHRPTFTLPFTVESPARIRAFPDLPQATQNDRRRLEEGAHKGAARMFFDVRFHSLGHSCVTYAANTDISEEIRREHVGHASDVHRGYTHREVQATRNALRAMPSLRPSKQKPA